MEMYLPLITMETAHLSLENDHQGALLCFAKLWQQCKPYIDWGFDLMTPEHY